MAGLMVVAVIVLAGFLISTKVLFTQSPTPPAPTPVNETVKKIQTIDQAKQDLNKSLDQQQNKLDQAEKSLTQP